MSMLLEVQGLSKTFGERKVVDNLCLQVKQGDVYGFLGQNGSGKTTTIRMIMGLVFPDSGEVRIDGHDLRTDPRGALMQVGAIVESPAFYTYLSGFDNLSLTANLVPGIKKARVDEVLGVVGLTDRARDKVRTYSLGMKQRLAIANALLSNPKLIILDEPTNGLDPQGLREIREMIIQLASEKAITFFISSHLLHEVEQICTRVGIIKKGKLLAEGDVKGLLHSADELVEVSTAEIAKAENALRTVKYVRSIDKTHTGLVIHVDRGYSFELNRCLVVNGVRVDSIMPKTSSLEEYFFGVTEEGDSK